MRTLKWFKEKKIGFASLVIVIVFLVQPGTLNAKTKSLPLSPMRKASLLNFPPLPKEIQDRIEGKEEASDLVSTKYDNSLSRDWALGNIGFFEVFTPMIQPTKSVVQNCSKTITVAVVDTGIDYTHPELKNNIWINRGETGAWAPPAHLASLTACRNKSCNGIDDDGNGFVDDVMGWDFVNEEPLPYDMHGHGTHIAGIISSEPGSGTGVVGVCPRVTVMPLKYYDNTGLGYNNLQNTVRAIQYAVKMGANIINYSGGGADPAPAERAAIEEAMKKRILFVAAAGNDGHNNDYIPYYPASYGLENIISVASVNKENQLLPSSNFGRTVHVAAPGLSVLSTLPGGKFGTMSGTSQATAFVTGAAALLESQLRSKGEIDFRKVKHWIMEGTKALPGNESKQRVAAGLLSLPNALQVERDESTRPALPVPPRAEVALRPTSKK